MSLFFAFRTESTGISNSAAITLQVNQEVIEQNSGYSVDKPWGAFLAFSNCSTRDGYTMGLNEAAKEQSWLDFYAFLKKTWKL